MVKKHIDLKIKQFDEIVIIELVSISDALKKYVNEAFPNKKDTDKIILFSYDEFKVMLYRNNSYCGHELGIREITIQSNRPDKKMVQNFGIKDAASLVIERIKFSIDMINLFMNTIDFQYKTKVPKHLDLEFSVNRNILLYERTHYSNLLDLGNNHVFILFDIFIVNRPSFGDVCKDPIYYDYDSSILYLYMNLEKFYNKDKLYAMDLGNVDADKRISTINRMIYLFNYYYNKKLKQEEKENKKE